MPFHSVPIRLQLFTRDRSTHELPRNFISRDDRLLESVHGELVTVIDQPADLGARALLTRESFNFADAEEEIISRRHDCTLADTLRSEREEAHHGQQHPEPQQRAGSGGRPLTWPKGRRVAEAGPWPT